MPNIEANGITMHYEIAGEGEPVLFLHGSGASWRMREPQIQDLSKHLNMIMVDYRGHGDTSKEFPGGRYDYL